MWNPAADGSAPRVVWQPGAIAVFKNDGNGGNGRPQVFLSAGIEAAGIEADAVELIGGDLQAAESGLAIESRREIVLSCGLGGAGMVALTGSGAVVLTRPAAVTGGWTLQSGTLRFFDQRSLGSGTATVTGAATLVATIRGGILRVAKDSLPRGREPLGRPRQDAAATVLVVGPEPTPGQTLTFHDFESWKRVGTATIVAGEKLAEPETLAAVNAFSSPR